MRAVVIVSQPDHIFGLFKSIENNLPLILLHSFHSFSWYGINQEMVNRFTWRYARELGKYDGFIVTHTPVFARLFENLNKPVILVNTCRYDQPFCYNGDETVRLYSLSLSLS